MENDILKLIHKYKQMKRTEPHEYFIALDAVIADFNELLKFNQKTLIIAFVQGAQWWEYKSTETTMWQSDVLLAEEEAARRLSNDTLGKTVEEIANENAKDKTE